MNVTVIMSKTGKEKTMSPAHAKILTGLGRASYLTRDMQAQAFVSQLPKTTLEIPMPPVAPPMEPDDPRGTFPTEVDSSGDAWDAEIHASTKLKNADGTWRKKPGRSAA